MNWHLISSSKIMRFLNTTPSGIDEITVFTRLSKYGKNQI